jgi:hypothetical protein
MTGSGVIRRPGLRTDAAADPPTLFAQDLERGEVHVLKKIGCGAILWVIPYLTAIPLLPLMRSDPLFFKTIMIVESSVVGAILTAIFFKSVERDFLREGLAGLDRLESVSLGDRFTNPRALLALPSLKVLECYPDSIDDPTVIAALEANGVKVTIFC